MSYTYSSVDKLPMKKGDEHVTMKKGDEFVAYKGRMDPCTSRRLGIFLSLTSSKLMEVVCLSVQNAHVGLLVGAGHNYATI